MRFALLLFATLLSAITGGLHALAIDNFLYWRYAWFDVLVHGFAGAMIGLASYTILSARVSVRTALWLSVLAALLIGLLWEGFEYAVNLTSFESGFIEDTVLDIVIDVAGALLAALGAKALLTPKI